MPALTLLALAIVVSCGTEPASGPVLPSRVVESGLCPNHLAFSDDPRIYMRSSDGDDWDLVPVPCATAEARRRVTVDDCCDGWHYSDCTCVANDDGNAVWTCDQIAWDGVCEAPGELEPLPLISDFAWAYSLFPNACSLVGFDVPDGWFVAGGCPSHPHTFDQPASGCYDGAWYEGCVCDTLNCLGLTWTCTSRRDEPRCPPAPEVE